MPYSAGTVFLEVIPSFNGLQAAARRAARDVSRPMADEVDRTLGDSAERSGERAGKKYTGAFVTQLQRRLKESMKQIGDIEIGADTSEAERKLAILLARTRDLSELDINVDINGAEALTEAREIARQLDLIVRDQTADIDIRMNASEARAQLTALADAVRRSIGPSAADYAEARRLNDEFTRRRRDAERDLADESARQSRRRLDQLREEVRTAQQIERERVSNASRTGRPEDVQRGIAAISARYEAEKRLADEAARQRVQAAVRGAVGEIAAARRVQAEQAEQDRERVRSAAAAAAERMAIARLLAAAEAAAARQSNAGRSERLNATVGQAANSFRLFNGYLLTAITLGPLLIPILAAMAAGLGAIGIAAVGAIAGVAAIAAGFGGVGGAIQALSGVDKEKRKQALGSGKGNEAKDLRGLQQAQVALSRAREDAGQRIAAAAERQMRAEQALSRAVRDAAEAQMDLVDARREAAEQLEDQNARLAAGLLDEQLAGYALQESRFRLNNVLEDPQATDRQKTVAQLEYDREVLAFEELQRQNRRLRAEVDKANAAGVEGSEQVVAAKEQIVAANEQIVEATRDVADADRDMARARVEEARTLADAERGVADALIDLQAKSVEAGVAGSAAMDQLRESMRGLSPAGQEFARFLYSLQPLLKAIRFAAQEGMLPGFQAGIQALVDQYGPGLVTSIGEIAKVIGDMARQAGEALTQPWWQQWFAMVAKYAPIFLQQFGSISGSLLTMIAGVLQAFAPYSAEIGDAFARIAGAMAEWGKNLAGSEGFAAFIAYVQDAGPEVFKLFENLLLILINLAIGLAPYSDQLLEAVIKFTDWLSSVDPATLAVWAMVFGSLIAAVQILAGFSAAFTSIFMLFTGLASLGGIIGPALAALGGVLAGPVGWIALLIAGLIALGAWLVHLYQTNEVFRDRVNAAWQAVLDFLRPIWDFIVAGLQNVGNFFMELWTRFVQPAVNFIIGIFQIMWDVISTIFNMIYQIIVFVVAPIFRALYEQYIAPHVNAIGRIISDVWNNYIRPTFELLANFIENNVAPAFQRGVDIVTAIWNSLIEAAKTPVRFIVDTVINRGIIDNFNKLVKVFPGMTEVERISLPQGFARGGVLPGYTPGRDVHSFYSPTAGRLELSGGEAILRPEVTRALGAGWVNGINRAARQGTLDRFLGGFADGGVLGWLKGAAGSATDAITGVVGNVANLLRDPAGVLKGVVEKLLGSDNTGWVGLLSAVPRKLLDGILASVSGLLGGADAAAGVAPSGMGGMGYQAMMAAISSVFPGARFTSTFRPGAITAVGTRSYHGMGRAVDIAPDMAVFNWLSRMFPDSRELFYSPAGAAQILNGRRNPNLAPVTRADHFDHIHWAMRDGGIMPNLYDDGGYLPPGLSLVANQTGKPEAVFTDSQKRALENIAKGGGNGYNGPRVVVEGDIVAADVIAEKIADRLDQKARDAAALHQLDSMGVFG